jgi:hypothetical protein
MLTSVVDRRDNGPFRRLVDTLRLNPDNQAGRRIPGTATRRLVRLLAAALTAMLLVGCSGVRLAYNTADFFIERYADDYLGLDGAQMEDWSPVLDAALRQHRQQELPYLAAFFDSAQNDARKGFTRADVYCLMDQFEVIYERHFRLAAATAAPLLAELESAQVAGLERKFRNEAREDAAENAPENTARRQRKRAERYEKNLSWWIGDLSTQQRAIVAEITADMPETRTWYRYRDDKRRELVALLRRGASSERIERFLVAWLVDYSDIPASLRSSRDRLRQGLADLVVRLDATLSDEQRRNLIDRLTRLRGDFMALQTRARMAPVGC